MHPRKALAHTLVIIVLAGLFAACGEEPPVSNEPVSDAGMRHIHGLGVNPADGSLMIATHTGLFRAEQDAGGARRVGDSHQDTMGFTVVGPDRFLGSGHPDPRADWPPLLGLIRSDDAGRTWESISLLGEADFHVLRAADERIYGVDATQGRLLTSPDGGETWEPRTPPAPVIDLAIHPDDPTHVLTSTEAGLATSGDAGRTWRPVSRGRAGLLAWTSQSVVLVDGSGAVHRSSDGGRSFEPAGEIGGQPAAFASHGSDLYVALHTNEVKRSADSGESWRTVLQRPTSP